MRQKAILLLLVLFSFSSLVTAQIEEDTATEEKSEDIDFSDKSSKSSKYFDDGRKSMATKAVTLNITNLIVSNVAFSYEHKLNNSFSLEATLGVIIFDLINVNLSAQQIANPMQSPIVGVKAKYYFDQRAIDFGTYVGAGFIHKTYALTSNGSNTNLKKEPLKVNMNGFRIYKGRQFLMGKSIAFDIGSYFGIASYKPKKGELPESWDEIGWDYGVYLKMGLFIL